MQKGAVMVDEVVWAKGLLGRLFGEMDLGDVEVEGDVIGPDKRYKDEGDEDSREEVGEVEVRKERARVWRERREVELRDMVEGLDMGEKERVVFEEVLRVGCVR